MLESLRVSAVQDAMATYPPAAPFHPSELYPEYPFPGSQYLSREPNRTYHLIREAFRLLRLDHDHYGTPSWNPLGEVIRPGDRVVLKPNFVLDTHGTGGELYGVITHPAVLRTVADFAIVALRGRGRILIADAPQADADFENLIRRTRLDALVAFYAATTPWLHFEVRDLRKIRYRVAWAGKTGKEFVTSENREDLPGDPEGYTLIDLQSGSEFRDFRGFERMYGADYDRSVTSGAHSPVRNQYLVANTILGADTVISLPKLKTHKKVGVTLNFKNLVGINGDKNYLPHFRVGPPSKGGDEFPDSVDSVSKSVMTAQRWYQDLLLTKNSRLAERTYGALLATYRVLRSVLGITVDKQIVWGNWYGNDTCWRMAVDLGRILFYGARDGSLRPSIQRRFFSVVDGIIGGQGDGPLSPDPVPAGVILAGAHPLAVDLTATRLMGFDFRRLRQFAALLDPERGPAALGSLFIPEMAQIEIESNHPEWRDALRNLSDPFLRFAAHPGWIGHIEVRPPAAA